VNVKKCSADGLIFVRGFQVVLNSTATDHDQVRLASQLSASASDLPQVWNVLSDEDGAMNGAPNAGILVTYL
jgi:hypothetical protein